MIALGQSSQPDAYNLSDQKSVCWVIFMVASFATTITALNMLIAIMSDTFQRITDSFELESRIMKIWVLVDYLDLIKFGKLHESKIQSEFIVIVTNKSDEIEQQ